MICAWYERQLKDDRISLWRDGVPVPALIAHAKTCPVCEAFVARELELEPLLAELAEESRRAEPSAAVKAELLAALNARQPHAVVRRNWVPRFAMAMAAVLCLVVVGILMFRRPSKTVAPPVAQKTVVPEKAPVAVQAAPVQQTKRPAVVTAQATKLRAPRTRPAPTSNNNDFLPTVMCDALTCAGPGTTVRVDLPASPLAAGGNNRTITADLLVGDDGLVRGIRVLR